MVLSQILGNAIMERILNVDVGQTVQLRERRKGCSDDMMSETFIVRSQLYKPQEESTRVGDRRLKVLK